MPGDEAKDSKADLGAEVARLRALVLAERASRKALNERLAARDATLDEKRDENARLRRLLGEAQRRAHADDLVDDVLTDVRERIDTVSRPRVVRTLHNIDAVASLGRALALLRLNLPHEAYRGLSEVGRSTALEYAPLEYLTAAWRADPEEASVAADELMRRGAPSLPAEDWMRLGELLATMRRPELARAAVERAEALKVGTPAVKAVGKGARKTVAV